MFEIDNNVVKSCPQIKDKLVYDLVNGIDTTKDLNRTFKEKRSCLSRIVNFVNGKDELRQANINENLQFGLQACTSWLTELSHDMANHAHGMMLINQSVEDIHDKLGDITDYVADFKDEYLEFEAKVRDSFDHVHSRLKALEVQDQIAALFDAWSADSFIALSPLERSFLVLDRLYWGDYGAHIRTNIENTAMLKTLKERTLHKLIDQLKKDLGAKDKKQIIHINEWLSIDSTQKTNSSLRQALSYQGDWSDPHISGYVYTSTQVMLNDKQHKQPSFYMQDIERVANRMYDNVFGRVA